MLSVATILHPTDFSPSAEQAFGVAETLAAREHARLVVLHVLPPSGRAVFSGRTRIELRKGNTPPEPLAALRRLGSTDPDVSIEHRLAEGNVVAEILRLAHEIQANVIVMGSRGRTGLARLALGSVADQLLRQARCTVVTVSAPEDTRTAPVGHDAIVGASG
jgi:nucleotide-binding universal stress UspA family protein